MSNVSVVTEFVILVTLFLLTFFVKPPQADSFALVTRRIDLHISPEVARNFAEAEMEVSKTDCELRSLEQELLLLFHAVIS